MRFIVTGGRVRVPKKLIFEVLTGMIGYWCQLGFGGKENFCLIEGEVRGVDKTCAEWAYENKIGIIPVPIDTRYDGFDGATSPRNRNKRMLSDYDGEALISFPGGPGTRHATNLALAQGLPVYDVEALDNDDWKVWKLGSKPRELAQMIIRKMDSGVDFPTIRA